MAGENRHVSQYWRLCHRRCAHLHFIPSHIILALTWRRKIRRRASDRCWHEKETRPAWAAFPRAEPTVWPFRALIAATTLNVADAARCTTEFRARLQGP